MARNKGWLDGVDFRESAALMRCLLVSWLVGLIVGVFALEASGQSAQRLSLAVDFPGGSGEVVALDEAAGVIHIQPSLRTGLGWPCWWYFRVDGAVAGSEMTLKVSANPGKFQPGAAALAASWAQPVHAVVSADDATWAQTQRVKKDAATQTAAYTFTAPAERFWLAWGPPFLPRHADDLLEELSKKHPRSEVFELSKTKNGRPVRGIRLGPEGAPLAVWVQARQHAWEAGSSWVGRGFAEWVAGDDPLAVSLRERCSVTIVPIMDVDRVAEGAGGKNAVPRDHNRDWALQPVYPEVAAAQAAISGLEKEGRLRVFIDLHNPAPDDSQSFFFGPFDYEAMPEAMRRPYDRWMGLAVEEIKGPPILVPKYRFATYVSSPEERSRMSSQWVREHSDPARVITVVLETAWNTHTSTASNYQTVGTQLGRTLARYLNDNGSPGQ